MFCIEETIVKMLFFHLVVLYFFNYLKQISINRNALRIIFIDKRLKTTKTDGLETNFFIVQ